MFNIVSCISTSLHKIYDYVQDNNDGILQLMTVLTTSINLNHISAAVALLENSWVQSTAFEESDNEFQ